MPNLPSQTPSPARSDFVDQYNRAIQFGQIYAGALPAHAVNHMIGGSDLITPAGIGAVDLTDPRLTNARTPTAHKSTHATGGTDTLSFSDIGACSTSDSRLSDARFPTAHKSTHAIGGSDALSISDIGACSSTDPRLSDARTPTAHASTHAFGGSDAISSRFVLAISTSQSNITVTSYFNGNGAGYSANATDRLIRILQSATLTAVSLTVQQATLSTTATGGILNLYNASNGPTITPLISSINTTADNNFYGFTATGLNVSVSLNHQFALAYTNFNVNPTSVRSIVYLYFSL
jgi:hypothetical protein